MVRPLAAALLACGCSGSSKSPPAPSCKANTVQCAILSAVDCVGTCYETYSCAGTASCAAALTSSGSQFPDLNCQQAPGCTWTGTDCVGTAIPCSDPQYQANSVACENVGCVLTTTCAGGTETYSGCADQTTQQDCEATAPLCSWE